VTENVSVGIGTLAALLERFAYNIMLVKNIFQIRGDQEGLFKLVTLNCILNRITGVTFGC
jgi:hypothetical protein